MAGFTEETVLARVRETCKAELEARGEPGRAALAWLAGPCGAAESGLERALEEALRSPPADLGPSELGEEADPIVVLGDLHGRWDAALPALRAAGVLAGDDDRFALPPGALFVQLGDALDLGFTEEGDPRGDALVDRFAPLVREALAAARLADADRGALLAALEPPGPARDDFACALARHDLVGAALAFLTIRALMRLEAEAAGAGARAVTLLGNHEIDLLSGRLLWFARQKRLLLRLAGLPAPEEIVAALRAAPDREAARTLLAPAPELAWLVGLPLAARAGPLLLVHGGPTRAASEELLARRIDSPPALAAWLEEKARAPFTAPFFAEGASIFSPGRAADDFVGDPALPAPWLFAARADFLAVGHSPFLGFAAGRWLDLDEPAVRERTRRIARLGRGANVLKLDTDLKRGSRAEALRLDRRAGRLDAVSADGGARPLLAPGEPLATPRGGWRVLEVARRVLAAVDAHRPPLLRDLAEPGLDAREHERIFEALERLARAHGADAAAEARRHVVFLLRAGPADLRHAARWLLAWEAGEQAGRLALAAHRRAVEDRIEALARTARGADGGALRVLLDPRSREVEGASYRLLEPVLERARRARREAGEPALPAIAAELVLSQGEPAVALAAFDARGRRAGDELLALPPDAPRTFEALEVLAREALRRADPPGDAVAAAPIAAPEAAARAPEAAPAGEPAVVPRRALERLFEINAAALGVALRASDCARVAHDGPLRPGWFEIRGPWRRLRGLLTPERLLLLADTAFLDPAAAPGAVRLSADGEVVGEVAAAQALLPFLGERDPVALYAQLKPEVLACLAAGEPERLGAGLEVRGAAAPWQRGCYIFTTPSATAARTFAPHNGVAARFDVPRRVLESWLALGLASLGIMIADAGDTLDPAARLGARDAALEVTAIGQEGAAALWQWRAKD